MHSSNFLVLSVVGLPLRLLLVGANVVSVHHHIICRYLKDDIRESFGTYVEDEDHGASVVQ
jgi:hypothetical protein